MEEAFAAAGCALTGDVRRCQSRLEALVSVRAKFGQTRRVVWTWAKLVEFLLILPTCCTERAAVPRDGSAEQSGLQILCIVLGNY